MKNTQVKNRLDTCYLPDGTPTRPITSNRSKPKSKQQRENSLWRQVSKPVGEGCWVWTGTRNQQGYGRMDWGGIKTSVHRISFFLATGRDPFPALVLHSCDNPSCVNPDHLFLGTNKTNSDDARDKGRLRYAIGRGTGHAKLWPSQVRQMRRLRGLGLTYRALAAKFGVCFNNVRLIVHHESWRHVK